jgi:hypothetical protein
MVNRRAFWLRLLILVAVFLAVVVRLVLGGHPLR